MKAQKLQIAILSSLLAFGLLALQPYKLKAQTPTTVSVTALMQGMWDGLTSVHKRSPVAVELRSGATLNGSTLSARKVEILSTTGTVEASFDGLATGDYWIVVRHGGNIPVASTTAQTIVSGSSATYDFSDQADKAFGVDATVLDAASNRYVILTGDVNGDRNILINDVLLHMVPNLGQFNPGQVPPLN